MHVISQGQRRPFFSLVGQPNIKVVPTVPGRLDSLYRKINQHFINKPTQKLIVTACLAALMAAPSLAACYLVSYGLWPVLFGFVAGISAWFGFNQWQSFSRFQKQSEFELESQNWQRPNRAHPMFESRNCTYNQIYSFYVDAHHRLWYALRDKPEIPAHWQPLYVENYTPEKVRSIQLKADAKNFMAKVGCDKPQAELFYKEMFLPKRAGETLILEDVSRLPSSEASWFSLPHLSSVLNILFGKRLALPKDSHWFMSNAGQIRHRFKDAKGQPFAIWNCTTVFIQEGQVLRMCDPYVREGGELRFALPPNLNVLDAQACGSRVLVLAFDRFAKQKVLLERTISYDDSGFNPLMPYSYNITDSNKRVVAFKKWEQHQVPANATGPIKAIQIGAGDNVQVALAKNTTGEPGFYFCNLQDTQWLFAADKLEDLNPLWQYQTVDSRSYYSGPFKLGNLDIKRMHIPHFSEHVLDTMLSLELENAETVNCKLVRSGNMIKSFIQGSFDNQWQLVLMPESQTKEYKNEFGQDCALPVQCTLKNNQLTIQIDDKTIELTRTPTSFATQPSSNSDSSPTIHERKRLC